jgi:HEPN domain-containing protein
MKTIRIILRNLCGLREERQPENTKDLKDLYFRYATDYYVAARFAFFARSMPTAGNLFHHAVELYLKGSLTHELNEQGRRNLGHRLDRIWRRFKQSIREPGLDRFDGVIAALDNFESIRYPEKTARLGAGLRFSLAAPGPTLFGSFKDKTPQYTIIVHQIDELVAELVQKSSLNSHFLKVRISEEEKIYLTRDNPTTIW